MGGHWAHQFIECALRPTYRALWGQKVLVLSDMAVFDLTRVVYSFCRGCEHSQAWVRRLVVLCRMIFIGNIINVIAHKQGDKPRDCKSMPQATGVSTWISSLHSTMTLQNPVYFTWCYSCCEFALDEDFWVIVDFMITAMPLFISAIKIMKCARFISVW